MEYSKYSKSFLDRDFNAKLQVGHTLHPSISLNKISYFGDYHDSNTLFKRICSMIKHRPEECKSLNFIGQRE